MAKGRNSKRLCQICGEPMELESGGFLRCVACERCRGQATAGKWESEAKTSTETAPAAVEGPPAAVEGPEFDLDALAAQLADDEANARKAGESNIRQVSGPDFEGAVAF